MGSSLNAQDVDALIEKYRALAETEQRRVDELDERNAHLGDAIRSSLVVPTSAFGMGYLRGYYGEKASIFGIPIDAAVSLLLKGVAALFGFSSNKAAQTAAKVFHDVANGAFASWTTSLGAEFGAKKRMEKPIPAPLPNTGAEEMPKFGPGPLTHADLAAIKAPMSLHTQPAMPEPMSPSPRTELAAGNVSAQVPQSEMPPLPPLNERTIPVAASTKSEAAPAVASSKQKPYRLTRRWAVDPEAEMRGLLQSVGAPSDPHTVKHLLTHENPGEELKVLVTRARAPA